MERKIDEVFQDGEVTLKVVESELCIGCYYFKPHDNCNDKPVEITGYCLGIVRPDKTDVKFEMVEK